MPEEGREVFRTIAFLTHFHVSATRCCTIFEVYQFSNKKQFQVLEIHCRVEKATYMWTASDVKGHLRPTSSAAATASPKSLACNVIILHHDDKMIPNT